jgi:subtilisin family serine protease
LRSPRNVIDGSSNVTDLDGHGTAVAGVAAAAAGSVRGVSPTSPIIPIKMLEPDGSTSAALFVKAIAAATASGAGVINISGAGPLAGIPPQDNRVVEMAIDQAFSRGVLIVAASGNEGSGAPDVPAAYPHVLSVAATDENNLRVPFSNYGRTVDLAAPGVDLTEPAPTAVCASGYQFVAGTSFSAPAVAGAAALLEAERPALSVVQRFQILRLSARDVAPRGWDPYTGFGVVDVAAALAYPAPPDDPGEVNDDVYWITGPRAATHPFALTTRNRRGTVSGLVDAAKDPLDVYRLELSRGERISATLTTASGGRFDLALWDPGTGPFDIGDRRLRHRVAHASGTTLRAGRARRGGTYFLSVRGLSTPPGGSTYRLQLKGT